MPGRQLGGQGAPDANLETHARHTYLRLSPELRSGVYGPRDTTAPAAGGQRHPILAGLESADTIPFGGYLPLVSLDKNVEVLATFIPDFPIYPPETSWMREPRTDIPAITAGRLLGGQAGLVCGRSRPLLCPRRKPRARLLFENASVGRWATAARSR